MKKYQFFIPCQSEGETLLILHYNTNSLEEIINDIKTKREKFPKLDLKTDRLCHLIRNGKPEDIWLSEFIND